jgi:hypothetical protein
VSSFEQFCESQEQSDQSLAQNVLDFFESSHDGGYATSSLWSASSALKSYDSYLLIKHSFKLDDQVPTLKRLLKNWETEDTVERSAVFKPEKILKFLPLFQFTAACAFKSKRTSHSVN